MRLDRSVARSTAFFGNMLARKKVFRAEDFSPHDKMNQNVDQMIDDALSNFPKE